MRTIESLEHESPACRECGLRLNDDATTQTSSSRDRTILRWLLPGIVLTLLPKCPTCFAVYFAAATGIGVAASTAASLRIIIMFACVAFPVVAMFWPMLRSLRRRLLDRHDIPRGLIVR